MSDRMIVTNMSWTEAAGDMQLIAGADQYFPEYLDASYFGQKDE